MTWLLTATTVATAVMFLVLLLQHSQLAKNQRNIWENFVEVLSSGSEVWNSMVETLRKKDEERDEEIMTLKEEIVGLKKELGTLREEVKSETPTPSQSGQESGS